MTVDDARRIFLSFDGAEESSHHGHPDFRIKGRIFGTLWPENDRAVVRLPMEMAESLAEENPIRFVIRGRSGGMGWLGAELPHADEAEFRDLAELAYEQRK